MKATDFVLSQSALSMGELFYYLLWEGIGKNHLTISLPLLGCWLLRHKWPK
jgi:hypothetical protein